MKLKRLQRRFAADRRSDPWRSLVEGNEGSCAEKLKCLLQSLKIYLAYALKHNILFISLRGAWIAEWSSHSTFEHRYATPGREFEPW